MCFNLQFPSCKENSHQMILPCTWYIELPFQSNSSNEEWRRCLNFGKLRACGYRLPPSARTGCWPCSSKRFGKKLSANNILRLWICSLREVPHLLAQLQPNPHEFGANLNQRFVNCKSHLFSFFWLKLFLVCVFVPISIPIHGLCEQMC